MTPMTQMTPTNDLPTVVLFTDSDVFAGTERHMLDLARGLRTGGTTVLLACPQPSVLGERGAAEGFSLVPIAKGGLIDRAAISTLRDLLRTGKAGIIHAHNGRTALSAAIATRLAGTGRCVVTQHFLEPARTGRRGIAGSLYSLAHRWVSRNTDGFIAISEAVAESMRGRGEADAKRLRVVLNGITDPKSVAITSRAEMRRSLGVSEDTPLIVCAARLEREKSVETLVEAMARLRDSHPNAVCLVAGEGAERAALATRISARNLDKTVLLLGFRDDALSLVAASDLFVLPSLAEPFGLALLEAMALGKPVIATDAGGPREIVAPGETGLLVPPANAGALAHALDGLLGDAAKAAQMGAKGRRRYEGHFTAARMARETSAVYEKALSLGNGAVTIQDQGRGTSRSLQETL